MRASRARNFSHAKWMMRSMRTRALALVLSSLVVAANAPPTQQGPQWEGVDVPSIGRVSFVVTRPSGRGPFPTVIIFHGSHGFAREYLDLARDLAGGGILAVSVCWFSGGAGEGRRFVTPLDCPAGTPAMPMAESDQALATIDSVVAAVRAMPESRDDQVALFGHSRGGGAVRTYALRGGDVQAVIMDSAGYTPARNLSQLNAAILILHGAVDGPADGGSPFSAVGKARAFEAALRAAHKPVEAHYYPNGTHNGIFANRAQRKDEVRRILQFMHRRVR